MTFNLTHICYCVVNQAHLMIIFKIKIYVFLGEIRTVVNLDREVEDEYILEIEAVDSGIPRLTSSATLHIQVQYTRSLTYLNIKYKLQYMFCLRKTYDVGQNIRK